MSTSEDSLRTWRFKQLRRSLLALARPASDQVSLFPDFVVTADELALDFDHWADVVSTHYGDELSRERTESLTAISARLATMSRDGAEFDPNLWTEEGLRTSEHWEQIRQLASIALTEFASEELVTSPLPPS